MDQDDIAGAEAMTAIGFASEVLSLDKSTRQKTQRRIQLQNLVKQEEKIFNKEKHH